MSMSNSHSSTLSRSLAWVQGEYTDLVAEEPADVEEFVGFTRRVTLPEWWSSLAELPGHLWHHLHRLVQHIVIMKRVRPGMAFQVTKDCMDHSWAYGVALLISLYSVRTSTRALVLPCDQAVPVLSLIHI